MRGEDPVGAGPTVGVKQVRIEFFFAHRGKVLIRLRLGRGGPTGGRQNIDSQ